MPDQTIPGHIRPLTIPELDQEFFREDVIFDPKLLNILERIQKDSGQSCAMFLLTVLNDENPMNKMRQRYAEISCKEYEPIIAPDYPNIMKNVISPLIQAKLCYVLGMPVACIAQAGLVGEMVAIWRFQMLKFQVNGKIADEKAQDQLFGRAFDKLAQEQRINVLRALGDLDDDTYKALNDLRGVRRQYLHFMIEPQKDSDADARSAYKNACFVVHRTLDIKLSSEGQFVFPPRVMEYIKDIVKVIGEQAQDEQV
jgi:hypothetical protein